VARRSEPSRVWRRRATSPQRRSLRIIGKVWLRHTTRTKDPTMTMTSMDLKELLEKTADPDFLREMIGFTAQRLMELEVETLTGAAHGARDPERLTHRNGYRAREWETRAGTVQLHIPRIRKGSSVHWAEYGRSCGPAPEMLHRHPDEQ
jgi:hypothetical protein